MNHWRSQCTFGVQMCCFIACQISHFFIPLKINRGQLKCTESWFKLSLHETPTLCCTFRSGTLYKLGDTTHLADINSTGDYLRDGANYIELCEDVEPSSMLLRLCQMSCMLLCGTTRMPQRPTFGHFANCQIVNVSCQLSPKFCSIY